MYEYVPPPNYRAGYGPACGRFGEPLGCYNKPAPTSMSQFYYTL